MRIQALQGLRWIFALMIFFHHILYNGKNLFLPGGTCAVSFFFILSSFVLCIGYVDKFQENRLKWKDFFIRRFLRVYPLHILCLLLFLLLNPDSLNFSKHGLGKLFSNLFLLQSWIPYRDFYFSYNALSWYLSSLLFIYAVFPFFIKIFTSRFFYGYYALWMLFMITSFLLVPEEKFHAIFYINPLYRISEMLIGGGIYLLCKKTNKWKRYIVTGWEFTSFVALFFAILGYSAVPKPYNYSVMWWIPITLLIIVFSQSRGVLSKYLSQKISIWFGELSFTFFMTQFFVLSELESLSIYNEQNIFVQIIISFIVQSIVTISVYYLFEKPMSLYIKKT